MIYGGSETYACATSSNSTQTVQAQSFSGNTIPLDVYRTSYNTSIAQVFTNYIFSSVITLGANAKIWINTTTVPSLPTAAIQRGGVEWESGVDLDLFVEVEEGPNDTTRVVYFFVKHEVQ